MFLQTSYSEIEKFLSCPMVRVCQRMLCSFFVVLNVWVERLHFSQLEELVSPERHYRKKLFHIPSVDQANHAKWFSHSYNECTVHIKLLFWLQGLFHIWTNNEGFIIKKLQKRKHSSSNMVWKLRHFFVFATCWVCGSVPPENWWSACRVWRTHRHKKTDSTPELHLGSL